MDAPSRGDARDAVKRAALPALLTPEQVSARLRVPVRTLAAWRRGGTGPPFLRVGRHVRYDSADVAAWLDERRA